MQTDPQALTSYLVFKPSQSHRQTNKYGLILHAQPVKFLITFYS